MDDIKRAAAALANLAAARRRAQEESTIWRAELGAALAEILRFADELRSVEPRGLQLHAKTEDGDVGQHPLIIVTLGASEALDHNFGGEAILTSPARLILELQLSCSVRVDYYPPFANHQRGVQSYELTSFLPSNLKASSLRALLVSFVERAAHDDWPHEELKRAAHDRTGGARTSTN